MVETLGDVMLNSMELDDGDIDDSGAAVAGHGVMDDDACELVEALEANKRSEKDYVWAEEPAGGRAALKIGDTIHCFPL